jgi:hypothetical protein
VGSNQEVPLNNIETQLAKVDIAKALKTDHPMVLELEFVPKKLDRSTSKWADIWNYGDNVFHFSLEIHLKPGVVYWQQRDMRGARIEPVRRVTTGSEVVGRGNRVLMLQDGELIAENSTFFPNQEFNDLGIGSSFYVAQERLYRALGIRHVRLYAAAVGRYLWARQGFRFMDRKNVVSLGNKFRSFLRGCDIPTNGGSFRESWDIANYHVSGAERDGDRIGKFFALQTFPAWEGGKRLDDQVHNKIAVASREQTFSRLPDKIPGAPKILTTF